MVDTDNLTPAELKQQALYCVGLHTSDIDKPWLCRRMMVRNLFGSKHRARMILALINRLEEQAKPELDGDHYQTVMNTPLLNRENSNV